MDDDYKPEKFVAKCVTITKEQNEFLMGERRGFKLSKFLQAKLDEYIKFRKEYRDFAGTEAEEVKDAKED